MPAVLLLLCFAVGRQLPAFAQSGGINFSEHIAPIIFQNCTSCHRPGQFAPFSLTSYAEVRAEARHIASATGSGFMPPWRAEPGFERFLSERRLSKEQISMIRRWVEEGMPEGDPMRLPPLPAFPEGWQLGQPDLVLEMPEAFAVPASGDDIYRNFVVPVNLAEDAWVSVIELRPAAQSVVHHALFFSDSTGAARRADAQDPQPGFSGLGPLLGGVNPEALLRGGVAGVGSLGGWVPGTVPARLPHGLAMPLPKGSDLVLQLHFHPDGTARTEKARIGIYLAPAKPARTISLLQVPPLFGVLSGIDIPAGESNYLVRDSLTLPVDVEAVNVGGHAHYLATEMKLTATRPDGEVRVLLWIREWDLDWQDQYTFQELVDLPRGTRLDAEIRYDNSSANPHNPFQPPRRVRWGEQSTDEMGTLLLTVSPKREQDLARLNAAFVPQLADTVRRTFTRDPRRPELISSGVVHAASNRFGRVSPGQILVIYGKKLGPEQLATARLGDDSRLVRELGGARVLINGAPAPLLYASSGQLSAIAPYTLEAGKGAQLEIEFGGRKSEPAALPVSPAAPGIFTADFSGRGPAIAVNEDRSINSAASPAPRGSIVTLYATGEGQTDPAGADGKLAAAPLPRPLLPVAIRIGGQPAEVQYAGAAPELAAGLMQINVRVPSNIAAGAVPLELTVGEAVSPDGVTIAVR